MQQAKAIEIKSDSLPAQEDHEASPLYRQEKFIYYYKDSTNNKEMYQSFNSDFSIFLVKLSSSSLKKWATIAHERKAVYLGHQINGQHIGLVDKVAVKNGKIIALVVDTTSIGLEIEKGNMITQDIDKAVYTVYHAMLRAAINEGFLKLRRNKEFTSSITDWYHTLFLRALNLPTLTDLEFAKFDFVIDYFICRFLMLENHNMSYSNAKEYISSKYSDVVKDALSDIEVYIESFKSSKDIRDITKLFKAVAITSDDTMRQVQQILKKIGTAGFITVTGSADYAIAGIIMSLYYKGYSDLLLNRQMQFKIEHLLEPYMKSLKFGNM